MARTSATVKSGERRGSFSAAFLDEAGCAGFRIGEGSSYYLTVALVLVNSQTPLKRAVDEYRASIGWPEWREFHFKECENKIRKGFLEAIAPLHFDIRALVVDKDRMVPVTPSELYRAVTTAVLEYAGPCLADTLVVIDEPVQKKQKQADLRRYIRKALNTNREALRVREVKLPASHTHSLVQIADMVCGAIHRKYESERRGKIDDRFRSIIAHHIKDETVWGIK